jgi:hypothetical protein
VIIASFDVTLILRGPIITQSSTMGGFGIDSVMARSQDHYYLPGTLIKGLLQEAWQELESVDPAFGPMREKWLGKESAQASGDEPDRGWLFLEDLLDRTTRVGDAATLSRIEIDPKRGSVEKGSYQVIECPYLPGSEVAFTGTFRLFAADAAEAENVRQRVLAGLNWVRAAGSERTVGFGRVVRARCGSTKTHRWSALKGAPLAVRRFDLELRFDRPFCVAKRRIAGNYFESEEIITGAALKGALASLVTADRSAFPKLSESLWAIRFTHAFPAQDGAPRPVVPPQSIVKVGPTFRDALRLTSEQAASADEELAFSIDWKPQDFATGYKGFGWPEVQRELRVRTGIHSENRRALEEALFAYQMVQTRGLVWKGSVTLPEVPGLAEELSGALEPGLFGVGKTKAHAEVRWTASIGQPLEDWRRQERPEVAVTLQTQALLCVPSRHLAPDGANGTSAREAMEREYELVWRELSGGSLELVRYIHRVSLAGGDYMRRRFQKGRAYRPYLLTDAGSVFLLRVNDEAKAAGFLKRASAYGIELSQGVLEFYGLDGHATNELWRYCPFLPENGFGEIALDVHVSHGLEALT